MKRKRPLVKRDKERIAFWLTQVVTVAVTVASIWFASQIGYSQAVRFAHWKEVRHERNLLRAVEHELALNERTLRAALRDVGSEDFRHLHLVTRAFDRVREGDGFFELDRSAVAALSKAYSPTLRQSIDKIREHRGGPILMSYAVTLTRHLEHMQDAHPLLKTKVAELDARLLEFDVPDPAVPQTWPPEHAAPDPEAIETETLNREATPGWTRAVNPPPYAGKVEFKVYWDHARVPPLRRGPVVIGFSARQLPRDRKLKRVYLCFTQRAPLPVWKEVEEPWQRKALAGDNGPGSFVLSHDLSRDGVLDVHQLLDPNEELSWRWVYVVVEDDQGVRSAAPVTIRKVGETSNGWKLRTQLVPERTIVLPKGYTP